LLFVALVSYASLPETIKLPRRHVVFFSPQSAEQARARRRVHREIMRRHARQDLAQRVRPIVIALLLAFVPPLGLLLLWTGNARDRGARLTLTCLTILNVCGQLALATMLKS
jgi:hypothetical protein